MKKTIPLLLAALGMTLAATSAQETKNSITVSTALLGYTADAPQLLTPITVGYQRALNERLYLGADVQFIKQGFLVTATDIPERDNTVVMVSASGSYRIPVWRRISFQVSAGADVGIEKTTNAYLSASAWWVWAVGNSLEIRLSPLVFCPASLSYGLLKDDRAKNPLHAGLLFPIGIGFRF